MGTGNKNAPFRVSGVLRYQNYSINHCIFQTAISHYIKRVSWQTDPTSLPAGIFRQTKCSFSGMSLADCIQINYQNAKTRLLGEDNDASSPFIGIIC